MVLGRAQDNRKTIAYQSLVILELERGAVFDTKEADMKRFRIRIVLWMTIFGVVWLMAGSAGTQKLTADGTVRELALLGHIGGPAMATAAYGDYALMGYSFEFSVIDVSDPAQPQRVGYLMLPSNDIQVVGSVAYVAGRDVLHVVSLKNPRQPKVVGSVTFDDAATGLAISGDTAFITVRNGLHIFDVRRHNRPRLRAWIALSGRCEGVAADNRYAYVTGSNGLHVVHVADTTKPLLAVSLRTNGYAESAALDGDLLYIADGNAGLTVVDVSAPQQPTVIGNVDTPGYATGVTVANGHAYVADGPAGVQVVDIADARRPLVVHSLACGKHVMDVAVKEHLLLTADRYHGLATASIDGDSYRVVAVGAWETPGFVGNVTVHDGAAYVVGSTDSSVHMMAIDNVHNLYQLARWETLGTATRVTVAGDFIFVADGYGGLQIVDRAECRPLTGSKSAFTFDEVQDVAVWGDYALLGGPAGIQVVDIADPRCPHTVACFCGNGAAYRLDMNGALVYAVGGEAGLQIVDVADPVHPKLIAQVELPGHASDVAVTTGYAYVAGGDSGLHVVDVRDPARAALVQSFRTTSRADAVSLDGCRVYVLDRQMGLTVYRANNPHQLVETARFDTPDVALSAAVADGAVYVTDRSGGLFVLAN